MSDLLNEHKAFNLKLLSTNVRHGSYERLTFHSAGLTAHITQCPNEQQDFHEHLVAAELERNAAKRSHIHKFRNQSYFLFHNHT